MIAIGLLFPPAPGRTPGPPDASAFGRAALQARTLGIDLVLGGEARDGELSGHAVRDGRWEAVRTSVAAALHRYPDGDRPEAFAALHAGLGGVPLVNPPEVVVRCRDKAATQRALERAGVATPPAVDTELPAALDAWGAAFVKPRHGAFGRGVRRVVPGDPLPERDHVLQRAVAPPEGWAGVSLRALVQREPGGAWVALPVAARVSRTDAVVNHARGAAVHPLPDLFGDAVDAAVRAAAVHAAEAVSAGHPHAGELGVDLVLDADLRPWVIEVNGKPRGRLAALAEGWPERFAAAFDAAVLRPVRFAAWVAGHPALPRDVADPS